MKLNIKKHTLGGATNKFLTLLAPDSDRMGYTAFLPKVKRPYAQQFCNCIPAPHVMWTKNKQHGGEGDTTTSKNNCKINKQDFVNYSWVYPAPPRRSRNILFFKTYSSKARTPAARPQYESSNPSHWGMGTRPPFWSSPKSATPNSKPTGGRMPSILS